MQKTTTCFLFAMTVGVAAAVATDAGAHHRRRRWTLPARSSCSIRPFAAIVAAAAEKMPEADYGFRPQGVPPEVRTFGQMVAHLVTANYNLCAAAKPEPAPKHAANDKEVQPKATSSRC